MRNNLSLKFYLYQQHPGANLPKLYLRITVNRTKAEVSIGYSIPINEWDDERQCSLKNKKLNE